MLGLDVVTSRGGTEAERLLWAIRLTRAALLVALLGAVMLVGAAVVSASPGLGTAARLACLAAALIALALMILNLLALRQWRRGRNR